MMSPAMKRIVKNARFKEEVVENFDKAFNSGYCWAVESYDNINVTMIQKYYEVSRMNFVWDDDDDYFLTEFTSETDARMLKFFVPKKLLCESCR